MISDTPHNAPLVNDLVGSGYSTSRFEYVEINVDGTVVDERRRRNAAPVANRNDVGSSFMSTMILSLPSLCATKLDGSLKRVSIGSVDNGWSRGRGAASSLID